MPAHFRLRIGLQKVNSQISFDPFLNPLRSQAPKFVQPQTLIFGMVTESVSTKRPICLSCSKPTSICLCNRLRNPVLHNSIAVTILQHSLEKKHPLNSTRIATIGLKNVDVFTVNDVNFEARFLVRPLGSTSSMGLIELNENRHVFGEMPSQGKKGEIMERSGFDGAKWGSEAVINFTIEKYGKISSLNECREASLELDQLLTSIRGDDYTREGFTVKKLGRKLLEGSNEYEESEEFEIGVPPGSVLLFPSERSIDVESVKFEVKNLIVLDGTWAKAKRMYNENPWLSLLPHVRLDLDNLSLYREVRHQPRPGYLSTIESIVYAMKVLGMGEEQEEQEDSQGLDGLLDVFESMIGDQRRCKDERLRKERILSD